MDAMHSERQRVALFVTCLVDLLRPRVGFAAARLLERAGYEVAVPAQSCCGQPNYNGGDRRGAIAIAKRTVRALQGFDYVVVPSGSCAAMIKCHYSLLLDQDRLYATRVRDLARRTHELTSFLYEVAGFRSVDAVLPAQASYHDGCSGLRELGIREQPRALLRTVRGLELKELNTPEVCCGFGGTFCVKYADVSNRMAANKTRDIQGAGAELLISGETGCLLNLEGKLHRDGVRLSACHVAEVLAGMAEIADEDR
jgi:L-lactate dehydrogenase complex protein LldE